MWIQTLEWFAISILMPRLHTRRLRMRSTSPDDILHDVVGEPGVDVGTEPNKPDNINPYGEDSVNSGLFWWATKFDVTRIGHAGSDPGLKTEMLANLSRVDVILFTNTSLSGDEVGHHFAIFLELWKQAGALKNNAVAMARY